MLLPMPRRHQLLGLFFFSVFSHVDKVSDISLLWRKPNVKTVQH